MSAHGIVDTPLSDKIIMRHRAERVKRLIPHDVAEKVLERDKSRLSAGDRYQRITGSAEI